MIKVLLVLQVFVTLALIAVILIQRSEGGGLGLGSSQGMGSFMSGRGTANLLTRITAILAAGFFILSLSLALLYKSSVSESGAAAILNGPAPAVPAVPGPTAPKALPASPASLPKTPIDAIPAPASPTLPAAPSGNAPPQKQQ